jgi:ubiquinone/menaquinone biosynthesis C-methylase UbiE
MNYDYVLGHPKLSDKNIHIFTLAPEKRAYWRNGISYIYGDLKKTCLKDNYFDFVVCLSTLEHVGMDNTRYSKDKNNDEKAFNDYEHVISEIRRILKPGGRLFVSVPFGMYANNKWLQVFDGAMIEKVKKIFGPEKVEEFYFRHEGSWRKSTHEECSGCSFVEVKSGAARKEFPVIGAEAVACLMLVK